MPEVDVGPAVKVILVIEKDAVFHTLLENLQSPHPQEGGHRAPDPDSIVMVTVRIAGPLGGHTPPAYYGLLTE